MKSRRTILVALSITAAVAFAAGCGRSGGTVAGANPSAASPSPSADPVVVLTASMTKSRGTSARYTLTIDEGTPGASKATGEIDPATRSESMTMTIVDEGKTLHEQVIMVGTAIYLKLDLPIPGVDTTKWMRLDATKLSGLSSLGIGDPSDPTSLEAFSKEIVTVQQTGPGRFTGTMDLTKAAVPTMSQELLTQMGAPARSVPFTATTDEQNRLTSMTINMPAMDATVPATTVTLTLGDFGAPVSIKAPPASQTEDAPSTFFGTVGG